MQDNSTRRMFLGTIATGARAQQAQPTAAAQPRIVRKGRIKQGLWRVNFGPDSKLTFDDQCREAKHKQQHNRGTATRAVGEQATAEGNARRNIGAHASGAKLLRIDLRWFRRNQRPRGSKGAQQRKAR